MTSAAITDRTPVAWRWRNRGGQWWYSETPPVNGENYVSEKAEIQPLYTDADLTPEENHDPA